MTATRLDRFVLTVSDLDRIGRFYAESFGAVTLSETAAGGEAFARLHGVRGAAATVRSIRIGAEIVDLVRFTSGRGEPYPADSHSQDLWFQHFALVTDDIAAAWARAARAGATPIGADAPVRLPESSGGVSAIKFRDPDGHPLELLFFPPDRRPASWSRAAHDADSGAPVLGIDHSAIAVSDTGRSEAFYSGLLGLDVQHRSLNTGPAQEALDGSFNGRVEVTALGPPPPPSDAVPGPHLEFLCNRIPSTGRPIPVTAMPCDIAATRLVWAVDDLDAILAEAAETRVRPVSPGAVPFGEGRRAAMLRDPDGHLLVLAGD